MGFTTDSTDLAIVNLFHQYTFRTCFAALEVKDFENVFRVKKHRLTTG